MSFFYGGHSSQRLYGFISYDEQKASEIFIKHYYQYLLLNYLFNHEDGYNDRAQAALELTWCEQSLLRWKLHPNWVEDEVLPTIERIKKLPIEELINEYRMFYVGE